MEKKMTFNYFYGTEADQFSFYRIQSRDNSDGTVNRQRREKGRGDKHKRGAAGRWNRQGNCIYDTWQW